MAVAPSRPASLPPPGAAPFLLPLTRELSAQPTEGEKGPHLTAPPGTLSFKLLTLTTKRPAEYSWVYVRQYCAKIDEAARNRMELIVRSLAEQNGVTEQLKAENQMEWVRQMNACKAQAEEVVKAELIYD